MPRFDIFFLKYMQLSYYEQTKSLLIASDHPFSGQLTDFNAGTIPRVEYHWGAVANATLPTFMKSCFKTTSAENLAEMDDLEQEILDGYQGDADAEVLNRSTAYGKAVGEAIITLANSDGPEECYNPNFPASYEVPTGATAQILTDLFGDNYAFNDYTHVDRTDIDGSLRSYASFFPFADEAAIRRLYGSIHYRAAIEVGVDQGIEIGKNIATLQFK